MNTKRGLPAALLLGCTLWVGAAAAQDDPPEPPTTSKPPTADELKGLVEEGLPKILGEENEALLRKLSEPAIGQSPYEVFDPRTAARQLLGRGARQSSECFFLVDDLGAPDLGDCTWARGTPGGEGAYRELRYDKNRLLGNIAFNSRPAAAEVKPDGLTPVQMDDKTAADRAAQLAKDTFGVPPEESSEIVAPDMWPVESLALGFAEQSANGGDPKPQAVVVEKLVRAPRMLDAGVGFPVPVLGSAFQASMTDAGPVRAYLRDWTPFELHPDVDSSSAFSRTALSDRIVKGLMEAGLSKVPSRISSAIAYVKARDMDLGCPEMDEKSKAPPGEKNASANAPAADGKLPASMEQHTYVPALVLWVSMGPDDPTEAEQAVLVSSTSFMEQHPLVSSVDKECQSKAD